MKSYTGFHDTIADLHERGFSEDFILFGNDLLWVQEKIFIRGHEFSIVEYHQFGPPNGQQEDLLLFGVTTSRYHIKGILINHYSSYTRDTPAIILQKLSDLRHPAQIPA